MNKVRLGLIGAGWWGTAHHLPTAMNREEVIMDSVSRLGSEELEIVKNEFNFDFASENFLDVIERKPDGIIVSSPHTLHYEHSIAALKAGIPVLCEKPIC
jgi:predicted dehydrogenase